MNHIKLFQERELEIQIITIVEEITFSNLFDPYEINDCPFPTELAILHQKDHIKSIFFDVTNLPENLTLGEFTKTYNKLAVKASKTIVKYLEDDPSLYHWCEEYNVDVPDYIKQANKYNL